MVIKMKKIKRLCAIKVMPKDSREKDFHLALADYFHKEFKHNGFEPSRHSTIIKISLPNTADYANSSVIIDCTEGKVFLRGSDIRDRYFGRLRRFRNGQRNSDAYHCVVQSANRLINRIRRLIDSLTEII